MVGVRIGQLGTANSGCEFLLFSPTTPVNFSAVLTIVFLSVPWLRVRYLVLIAGVIALLLAPADACCNDAISAEVRISEGKHACTKR